MVPVRTLTALKLVLEVELEGQELVTEATCNMNNYNYTMSSLT